MTQWVGMTMSLKVAVGLNPYHNGPRTDAEAAPHGATGYDFRVRSDAAPRRGLGEALSPSYLRGRTNSLTRMTLPSLDFATLREQTLGVDTLLETPFGERLMVYADFTA